MATVFKYRVFCGTCGWVEFWDENPPVSCPNNYHHIIDPDMIYTIGAANNPDQMYQIMEGWEEYVRAN